MSTGTNQTEPTTDTSADTSSRATTVARRTVGLLFAAWLVDYIDRLVIVLALPSIEKELGVAPLE